jgi:hypothetical protein
MKRMILIAAIAASFSQRVLAAPPYDVCPYGTYQARSGECLDRSDIAKPKNVRRNCVAVVQRDTRWVVRAGDDFAYDDPTKVAHKGARLIINDDGAQYVVCHTGRNGRDCLPLDSVRFAQPCEAKPAGSFFYWEEAAGEKPKK